MYRKIATVGVTAAAIVGVGTAALAASGSGSTTGNGTSGSSTASTAHHKKVTPAKRRAARRLALRSVVHGSFVTKGKDGYVTHDAIHGSVTAVSATAVTVKAADGFTQTFTLNTTTKVRERKAGQARGTTGKVSDLKAKDHVIVVGKAAGSARPTATVVVDGLKK